MQKLLILLALCFPLFVSGQSELIADKLRLNQTTLPTTAVDGEIRYDSSSEQLRQYNASSSSWVNLGGTSFARESVRVASAADIGGTFNASGGITGLGQITGGATTIDGQSVNINDRVLLKSQTVPSENGIYVITGVGTYDRDFDFDNQPVGEVLGGVMVYARQGSTNNGSIWILTNTENPVILNSTSLTFERYHAGGDGISVTENDVAVDLGTDPGLEFVSGELEAQTDTTKGIEKLSGGLSVKVDATTIQFDGSGNLETVTDASTKADTDLGNLTSPTAINQDLLPGTPGTYDLGNPTDRWELGFFDSAFFGNASGSGARVGENFTMPSGALGSGINSQGARVAALWSENRSVSEDVRIETGNASGGDSGDIIQQTGTATGTRGGIYHKDGTEGTDGQCWVSDGVGGKGKWDACPAGGGGINYIERNGGNWNAEIAAATGWATYADPAADSPADGTGGVPNSTIGVTTTANELIIETNSFELVKNSGASRQGEGVSFDFTIDPGLAEKSTRLFIDVYYRTSANYDTGDIRAFVYDKDTPTLLTPVLPVGASDSGMDATNAEVRKFTIPFWTTAGSNDYRLIFHIADTDTDAWDFFFDDVRVSPDSVVQGAIVGPWESFTPTGSWTSGITYTGRKRRIGDSLEMEVSISVTGTISPGATNLTIDIPDGLAIDTSKMASTDNQTITGEIRRLWDNGTDTYANLFTTYNSTTSVFGRYALNTSNNIRTVTDTAPIATPASTDQYDFHVKVPIDGWDSGAFMSATEINNQTTKMAVEDNQASATTSITAGGGATKIDFGTAELDSHVIWDGTDTATIQSPGHYFVAATASGTMTASNAFLFNLNAYVNGARKLSGLDQRHDASSVSYGNVASSVVVGILWDLEAGDTVDIRANWNHGGSSAWSSIQNASNLHLFRLEDTSVYGVHGVNELIEASSAGLVNYTITAGQLGDLTSIELTPGIWDIKVSGFYYSNGATTTNAIAFGVSTTAGNSAAGLVLGDNYNFNYKNTTNGSDDPISISNYTVTVTDTTTYYLKGRADNSITNLQNAYKISARRIQ